MQGTYQKKVDEADTLTKRLAALQKKHDDLAAENAALKTDLAEMTLQRDKLTTDLATSPGSGTRPPRTRKSSTVFFSRGPTLFRSPSSNCAGGSPTSRRKTPDSRRRTRAW